MSSAIEHEITAYTVLDVEKYNIVLRTINSNYKENQYHESKMQYQKCVYFNTHENECVRVICTAFDPICPVAFSEYAGPYEYKFDNKKKEKYRKVVAPLAVNENERIAFINCTIKNSTETDISRSGMYV